MADDDGSELGRFVQAQAGTWDTALAELEAGRKRSHWMWFVFPQMRGLGMSSTAQHYGIASLAEAEAYLAHPVLGPRLESCTRAALRHPGTSLTTLFGSPDDLKFRSSMTLFARAAGGSGGVYAEALSVFCGGREDDRTLALIGAS